MMKSIALMLIVFVLFGCNTTTDKRYYSYDYDGSKLAPLSGKRVVIAPMSLMRIQNIPQTHQNSDRITDALDDYLQQAGYDVVDSRIFQEVYDREVEKSGGLYDTKSGAVDQERHDILLRKVFIELKRDNDIDYVVFPSLYHSQVEVNDLSKRARWDGVERKMMVGSNVTTFVTNPMAVSLYLIVISTEKGMVLKNRAGLEIVVEAVREKDKIIMKSRTDLYDDDAVVFEAIEKVMHPFIPYTEYGN
ncbi:hypothetical protein [Rubellicoccus peritrichatus]|uniref:Lipoprotein n=1 Tax=Rubellicoccus peritrichatus TaxID=3080537 RepID=A0AAQ3LAV8_9BACT|nr:hypothetical protein [Puniceicoccus sp. CR14]WOO42321.1 hypothetical protein RZN69_04410 [Puniceicoccus sp. CR14]